MSNKGTYIQYSTLLSSIREILFNICTQLNIIIKKTDGYALLLTGAMGAYYNNVSGPLHKGCY